MKHTIYKDCKFCLESETTGILFDYPQQLEDDNILDGFWVEDLFTDTKTLPKGRGVYACDIEVKYWPPQLDMDGDIEINALNIKKLL